MKLNVTKIRAELKRIGKTQTWLAEKTGVSRQALSSKLVTGNITQAQFFADALRLNVMDLIKE